MWSVHLIVSGSKCKLSPRRKSSLLSAHHPYERCQGSVVQTAIWRWNWPCGRIYSNSLRLRKMRSLGQNINTVHPVHLNSGRWLIHARCVRHHHLVLTHVAHSANWRSESRTPQQWARVKKIPTKLNLRTAGFELTTPQHFFHITHFWLCMIWEFKEEFLFFVIVWKNTTFNLTLLKLNWEHYIAVRRLWVWFPGNTCTNKMYL